MGSTKKPFKAPQRTHRPFQPDFLLFLGLGFSLGLLFSKHQSFYLNQILLFSLSTLFGALLCFISFFAGSKNMLTKDLKNSTPDHELELFFKPFLDSQTKLNKVWFRVSNLPTTAKVTLYPKKRAVILMHPTLADSPFSHKTAIAAHELGHALHKDAYKRYYLMVFLYTITTNTSALVALYGFWFLAPVLIFLTPIFSFIAATFSKRAELKADIYASKITSPESVIKALSPPLKKPKKISAQLWSTHPSDLFRIRNIKEHYFLPKQTLNYENAKR